LKNIPTKRNHFSAIVYVSLTKMVLRYELYEHGTPYIIQIFIRHARARAMHDTFRERYDEAMVASVIHGSCTSYRIKRSPSCRDLWTFALLLADEIDRSCYENLEDRKRI